MNIKLKILNVKIKNKDYGIKKLYNYNSEDP